MNYNTFTKTYWHKAFV